MEDKKAEQIIKNSPKITQKLLNEANKHFIHYLFYETTDTGRAFYCTCCNKEFSREHLQRTKNYNDYEILTASHNESGQCPLCKSICTIKNIKKSKACKNLKEYINFAFIIPKSKNQVYILCCVCCKDYKFCKTPNITYYVDYIYYITPKNGMQFKWGYCKNDFYKEDKIKEPFSKYGSYSGYGSYEIIGMDKLKNTFLKYCGIENYKTDKVCKYLTLYPTHKPFEIMVKLGLYSYVDDVIYSNKENKRLIDWQATKAQDVFKMSKQDFNELRKLELSVNELKLHKQLNKIEKITMSETKQITTQLKYENYTKELLNIANQNKLSVKRTVRYLEKSNKDNFIGTHISWRDYINMAVQLNYDLSQEVVIYPKDLIDAHDQAVEIINLKKAEEDRAKNKELEKQQKSLYKKRQKQYAYQNEQFAIVVPKSVQDIVAEGQALKHCVGGYAERHAKGKLTILFLRDKSKIDSPLYTIEMWDTKLIQVQGYKNETPLTPKAQKFLNEWLEYVQNQKSGQKKQNKKATAQAVA